MQNVQFSETSKRALTVARSAALAEGARMIRPDHLLHALLSEDDGAAVRLLSERGVDVSSLRSRSGYHDAAGVEVSSTEHEIPFSTPARRVISDAMAKSQLLGQPYVGTIAVLLALLDSGSPELQANIDAPEMDVARLTWHFYGRREHLDEP